MPNFGHFYIFGKFKPHTTAAAHSLKAQYCTCSNYCSSSINRQIIQLYAVEYGCHTMSKSGEKIVGHTEKAFLTGFK